MGYRQVYTVCINQRVRLANDQQRVDMTEIRIQDLESQQLLLHKETVYFCRFIQNS